MVIALIIHRRTVPCQLLARVSKWHLRVAPQMTCPPIDKPVYSTFKYLICLIASKSLSVPFTNTIANSIRLRKAC